MLNLLIVLYLVLMAAGSRSPLQRAHTEHDFFEAGRSATWITLTCSLAGTLLTLTAVIGAMLGGGQHGVAFATLLWLAFIPGAILAAIFLVPVLRRARVQTLPEYLGRRYTQGVRLFAALTYVVFAIFLIAAGLHLADWLTTRLLGWPPWTGPIALAALTLWYVHYGGLAAVQSINRYLLALLLAGLALTTIFAAQEAGGWNTLAEAWNARDADYRSAYLPADHADWPWLGVLLGIAMVMGPWQWFGNQAVIQHLQSARTDWHAQAALIWAALALLLATPLLLAPGIIAYLAQPDGAATGGLEDLQMLAMLLPGWTAGLLVLALFAALQSSLGSLLTSSARVISHDLALSREAPSGDSALVWGRRWAWVLVVAGFATLPLLTRPTDWTHGFLLLTGSFQGPLLALTLAGLLSRAATPAAGMMTLLAGLVTTTLLTLIGMPGLFIAGVSFFFALAVILAVSKHTPRLSSEALDELVYRHDR